MEFDLIAWAIYSNRCGRNAVFFYLYLLLFVKRLFKSKADWVSINFYRWNGSKFQTSLISDTRISPLRKHKLHIEQWKPSSYYFCAKLSNREKKKKIQAFWPYAIRSSILLSNANAIYCSCLNVCKLEILWKNVIRLILTMLVTRWQKQKKTIKENRLSQLFNSFSPKLWAQSNFDNALRM